MFQLLASLEWKGMIRKGDWVQKILMGLGKAYFGVCYLVFMVSMSFGLFELGEDLGLTPFQSFFKYAIYLLVGDLIIRYFFQKMPTTLVKPLLIQNIKKSTIVNFCLTKTSLSFFNLVNLLMGIAVGIQLYNNESTFITVLLFSLSFTLMFIANSFLVQLLNNINKFALPFLILSAAVLTLDYYEYVDITQYTKYFFEFLYNYSWFLFFILVYLFGLIKWSFNYYYKNLSLDSAIVVKKEKYTYYELSFLNRFGKLAPFLKLDIKLLTRNKRTRMVLWMSGLFLLYGLLFFTVEPYKNSVSMTVLGSIMITGGFMMLFGQYVPSWDSSYYPLMMTQNVPYRTYLESKWILMVIATVVSTILASFYLFFGWKTYLIIVAIGCYNIGWNCYLSLITGAFVRSKVDLSSTKSAFGDKKAFNIQTLLLSIPTIGIPMLLYMILNRFLEFNYAIIAFAFIGLSGIVAKPLMFRLIEKLYKSQKHTTLKAYK